MKLEYNRQHDSTQWCAEVQKRRAIVAAECERLRVIDHPLPARQQPNTVTLVCTRVLDQSCNHASPTNEDA